MPGDSIAQRCLSRTLWKVTAITPASNRPTSAIPRQLANNRTIVPKQNESRQIKSGQKDLPEADPGVQQSSGRSTPAVLPDFERYRDYLEKIEPDLINLPNVQLHSIIEPQKFENAEQTHWPFYRRQDDRKHHVTSVAKVNAASHSSSHPRKCNQTCLPLQHGVSVKYPYLGKDEQPGPQKKTCLLFRLKNNFLRVFNHLRATLFYRSTFGTVFSLDTPTAPLPRLGRR